MTLHVCLQRRGCVYTCTAHIVSIAPPRTALLLISKGRKPGLRDRGREEEEGRREREGGREDKGGRREREGGRIKEDGGRGRRWLIFH